MKETKEGKVTLNGNRHRMGEGREGESVKVEAKEREKKDKDRVSGFRSTTWV